jgi:hypothetical protein
MSGEWWSFVTIGGPILFALVILWALLRNKQSPRETAATEQATSDLRDSIETERREKNQP